MLLLSDGITTTARKEAMAVNIPLNRPLLKGVGLGWASCLLVPVVMANLAGAQ